ncbi:MAG: FG-GAP repeat protein [Alphaproteobacteria bacterium]|nr:FG-GAP repeat protein [Alphaproteobacteria bacterium]MCB9792081.1 FG-GAP repeat protein [Alphaproteobacteria bacterium]
MRTRLLLALTTALLGAGCGEKDSGTDSDSGAVDADGDGYDVNDDCDDLDPDVNPGAEELCDDVDQDCDGSVDEGASTTLYADNDGDGYGVEGDTTEGCHVGDGWALQAGDCDDSDENISPGAAELCDEEGVDEDCDGDVNEPDAEDATAYYPDEDADGYGDQELEQRSCEVINGYVTEGGDCDDTDPFINPRELEVCDELDNNCDGEIDEPGAAGEGSWFADADGDNYGDPSVSEMGCVAPEGMVGNDRDCDDNDAAVNPSATEVCDNQIDDDCDGTPNHCAWSGVYDLDAEYTSKLYGEGQNDQLGYAMQQGVGDDNGDGVPDLIVGSRRNSSRTGAAYRMQGTGNSFDRVASDANARMVGGSSGEQLGERVAFVGDITGDGNDDVLTGASLNDVEDRDAGAAYLFEGPLLSGVADQDAIAIWYGEARDDWAGFSITGTGDLTGDGAVDLAISAPIHDNGGGAVYIVEGPITSSNAAVSLATVSIKLDSAGGSPFAGWWMAGNGDHNGDGQTDLLVGAPVASVQGDAVGAAWLYEGPISTSASLADNRYDLNGHDVADYTGGCVDWAGDFNGDGYGDIIVSAYDADVTGADAGVAYLVFGPVTGDLTLLSDADVVFTGEAQGDRAGYFVGNGGDIDGDGYVDGQANDDLLIGAPEAGSGGRVYLVYGSNALTGQVSLADADARFDGSGGGDDAGYVTMGVGDFDSDGFADFIVGAPQWDDTSTNGNGAVYLLTGRGF